MRPEWTPSEQKEIKRPHKKYQQKQRYSDGGNPPHYNFTQGGISMSLSLTCRGASKESCKVGGFKPDHQTAGELLEHSDREELVSAVVCGPPGHCSRGQKQGKHHCLHSPWTHYCEWEHSKHHVLLSAPGIANMNGNRIRIIVFLPLTSTPRHS